MRIIAAGILIVFLGAAGAEAGSLLWQTNSEGTAVHVFEVGTWELVKRIEVGPEPHGIAAPANSPFVLVTLESNGQPSGELVWVDTESFEIAERLRVGREPHALAISTDGRWAYVPCRDGHYWVVDVPKRRVATKVWTGGRPHNTTPSPDGRFMYLSPMGAPKQVSIADVGAGHRIVGEIPFRDSVRPPALSADGQWLFHHVDGLNGFQVADVKRREIVATVEHSKSLGWFLLWPPRLGWIAADGLKRCHGLAIRPDQKEIWSVCGAGVNVHRLEAPGFPEVVRVPLEDDAYWLTFSPDSRYAFAPVRDRSEVAVIDAKTKRIVTYLETGPAPKRNLVIPDRRVEPLQP